MKYRKLNRSLISSRLKLGYAMRLCSMCECIRGMWFHRIPARSLAVRYS
jgi:hypothetical protein